MKKLTAEQVAELSPQMKQRYRKRLKTVQRNRKILSGCIIFIAAAAIIALLSVTVFFKVSEVKVVKAGTHYTAEEIIDAAGVDVGDSILLTKWNDVAKKVTEKLPYVLSVQIKKSIDGRVSLTVNDDKADKLVEFSDGYAVTDAELKVLEILKEKPESSQLTLVKMNLQGEAKLGVKIEFKDGDAAGELFKEIESAIKEVGLGRITGIDITDTNNIYLEYQNRYRLFLGDSGDIVYKLKEAKKIIAKEDESNPNQIGEINLSILKKVFVEPLDSLEETTTEVTQVTDTSDADGSTDITDETDTGKSDMTEETTEFDSENLPETETTGENENE